MAALAAVAGCGGKPPICCAPPPPPPTLALSCPAPLTREASSPQGTDVHWDAPTPAGGREPYSVQCTPGSGSVFAIGETAVGCTVTDADMAQASCGFGVTVQVSQSLAKTKFTAFGDSITAGAISTAPLVMLDGPETYPFKLEQMLLERYPSQPVVVMNRGRGGETTLEGAVRLPGVLEADQPEVLLLLEGINNIGLATNRQVSALRTMITAAQARGVDVIIATVMPMLPTSHVYKPTVPAQIDALNTQIFALSLQYGLGSPVDLFALFEANPHLIGKDGLHPTAEGQTRIAEAFRDEIVRRYDSRTTSLRTLSTRR